MSSWTYRTQGNEMSRFSATLTLSDFPLLIGEILRRGDMRSQRGQSVAWLFGKSRPLSACAISGYPPKGIGLISDGCFSTHALQPASSVAFVR
jgi:hypothetical protein